MEQFFSAALGLPAPWRVTRVDLIEEDELFEVHVAPPLELISPALLRSKETNLPSTHQLATTATKRAH